MQTMVIHVRLTNRHRRVLADSIELEQNKPDGELPKERSHNNLFFCNTTELTILQLVIDTNQTGGTNGMEQQNGNSNGECGFSSNNFQSTQD